MSRDCCAHVNLDALRHNLARVRALAPGHPVMAVVKANAYGHGLAAVAHGLAGADAFAVACIEEAVAIREAGLHHRVVLLEGVFSNDALASAIAHRFEVTIHDYSQLAMLQGLTADDALPVWLKVDTGMNRLGFSEKQADRVWQQLERNPGVCQPPGLLTHLANADDPGDDFTRVQIDRFNRFAAGRSGRRSIANSAGITAWPESRHEWVRPGIMLYGASPLVKTVGHDHGLRPVMTVSTRLIATKHVEAGERVGYSGTWVANRRTRIGIAAIGYGDGYPRHAPNGTPVLINGRRQRLVGRVSMDMIAVELDGNDAVVGDRVVVWGDGLPVEEIARAAGTIPYELLCGVTQRVKLQVVDRATAPVAAQV